MIEFFGAPLAPSAPGRRPPKQPAVMVVLAAGVEVGSNASYSQEASAHFSSRFISAKVPLFPGRLGLTEFVLESMVTLDCWFLCFLFLLRVCVPRCGGDNDPTASNCCNLLLVVSMHTLKYAH